MISSGNDIVALNAINIGRTKQQNFYSKIITVSEKGLYDQFSDRLSFEQFVWLAWSIKESVYKYLQRINPELIFSPAKIIIQQLDIPVDYTTDQSEGCGFNAAAIRSVVVPGPQLHSRSIINNNFIFSAVNEPGNFEHVYWGIRQINSTDPDAQSHAVREFVLEKLNTLLPGTDLLIAKSGYGFPVLLQNGIEIPVPVSLAHHEDYVAYSFLININLT